MLPFLLVAYFVIELIERHGSEKLENILTRDSRYAFIPASFLGLIPQCGFSGMAANLYAGNVISLATLVAVFISTSDEAIPLLIASGGNLGPLIKLLVLKLVTALIAGFIIELFCKKGKQVSIEEVDCHDHNENESIWVATLRHTAQVFFFIFITILLTSLLVAYIGEDNIISFVQNAGALQILAAGLIGMIPNCASSVLLTQMFAAGQLSFAAMFAGLCAGAGIGPLVLVKTITDKKRCISILALLYLIGITAGFLVDLLP